MKEHDKNFYSLEELKRTRDCYDGYLDNEEVYYFVGAIRYACDEIERLNNIINKAIEYINENGITNITWLGDNVKKKELFKGNASLYELLEILKGSDKE